MVDINLLKVFLKRVILGLLVYSFLYFPVYANNHLPCESSFEKDGSSYEILSKETIDGDIVITILKYKDGVVDDITVKKHPDGTVTIEHNEPHIGKVKQKAKITIEYDKEKNITRIVIEDTNTGKEDIYEGDRIKELLSNSAFYQGLTKRSEDLLNKIDYSTCPPVDSDDFPLIIALNYFKVTSVLGKTLIEWKTDSEFNNAGFRIWRGIEDSTGYYEVTSLRELSNPEQINYGTNENCFNEIQGQLKENNFYSNHQYISAIGNSIESTCYSFIDISDLNRGTYYYLLEDISDDGTRKFHCDQIDVVTIGHQKLFPDLNAAIAFCKQQTAEIGKVTR